MPVLTPNSAHMQRFIHPIRAILFGANVLPITRGVTGAKQTVESGLGDRVEFDRAMSCQVLRAPAALWPSPASGRRPGDAGTGMSYCSTEC